MDIGEAERLVGRGSVGVSIVPLQGSGFGRDGGCSGGVCESKAGCQVGFAQCCGEYKERIIGGDWGDYMLWSVGGLWLQMLLMFHP
jgi:hypothetical protein